MPRQNILSGRKRSLRQQQQQQEQPAFDAHKNPLSSCCCFCQPQTSFVLACSCCSSSFEKVTMEQTALLQRLASLRGLPREGTEQNNNNNNNNVRSTPREQEDEELSYRTGEYHADYNDDDDDDEIPRMKLQFDLRDHGGEDGSLRQDFDENEVIYANRRRFMSLETAQDETTSSLGALSSSFSSTSSSSSTTAVADFDSDQDDEEKDKNEKKANDASTADQEASSSQLKTMIREAYTWTATTAIPAAGAVAKVEGKAVGEQVKRSSQALGRQVHKWSTELIQHQQDNNTLPQVFGVSNHIIALTM